jgi:DNA-binding CsgD family transcriptional regulator
MRDAARILARPLRKGHVAPTIEDASLSGQSGVLLIDDRLRSRGVTEAARAWFALLNARQKPEQTLLPIHVYEVVGRLLAAEAGEDPHRLPRVRVRASDGRWAIVEAARVNGMPDTIAVSVHAAGVDDVLALVSRVYGLTARERELVELVLEGIDTRELARRMFISRYTVNDHLKSVFAKLGIRSRRELVTGLFGQAG